MMPSDRAVRAVMIVVVVLIIVSFVLGSVRFGI
jgi:hypothetical protein